MAADLEPIEIIKRNQITIEYEQLSALERTKSQTYSQIFTIAITIFIALMALFSNNPQVNSKYILIIPITLLVWFSFVMYNMLYLRVLRDKLFRLEEKIYEIDKYYFDTNAARWHSKCYPHIIKDGLSKPLFAANIVVFLSALFVSFYFGYGGVRQILCEYRTSFEKYSELVEAAQDTKHAQHAMAKKEFDRIDAQFPIIFWIYIALVAVGGCFVLFYNRYLFKTRSKLIFIWK